MGSITPSTTTVLRVGLVGCGELSQVVHIPTLGFLSDQYRITYLCDVSSDALSHCKSKIAGAPPKTTRDITELCASPIVDVVFIANSTEYHAEHAIIALQHDKSVLLEKPICLSLQDADAIAAAEAQSKGRVFVGYMRRYAAAFVDAIREIGGLEKITYARVHDIIGPNATFVNQSGTFPKKFTDFRPEDTKELMDRKQQQLKQALEVECGLSNPPEGAKRMWQALNGLGSHDISAMREALGMPIGVLGAFCNPPFWSALFQYPNFAVSYESGLDQIPRFDAHIEVYSPTKQLRIQYDTPYVKGLPTSLSVSENLDGALRESTTRRTYEDPYTLELLELHAVITEGKKIKTTVSDAKKDLEIFGMIIKAAYPESGLKSQHS